MRRIPRFLGVLLACFVAFQMLGQSGTRIRINIDDPSFDVAGYELAVQILKSRDPKKDDPVNWVHNSYTYFANLHDDFSRPDLGCIHGSEVFLPWHRELLYRYESAIRAAQPGRTDNLVLPYWNWTAKPSGQYYPKPFENTKSVLYSPTRWAPPGGTYTADPIQKMLKAKNTWIAFAGGECTVNSSCVSGLCATCPSSKYGGLESPFHNKMHGWLGDPMANPETAAEDPIFWSFHAFIDVIYQQWQCMYPSEVPNCPDCNFRAMTTRKVRDVIDVERQLGYRYDIIPSCTPKMPPATFTFESAPIALESAAAAPPSPFFDPERTIAAKAVLAVTPETTVAPTRPAPWMYDIALPESSFETADIRLSGLPIPSTFSYGGDVYLYPPTVKFRPEDPDFKSRYRVGEVAIWERADAMSHEGHVPTASVDIDVTSDFQYLARVNRGATWKLAVVIGAPTSVDESTTVAAAVAQLTPASATVVLNSDTRN
ncbi:MAG TPA: tyrosinase family protein [Thermoanaerobaculia bacterium]